MGVSPTRPTLASLLRNYTAADGRPVGDDRCARRGEFRCHRSGHCVPAFARCNTLLECDDGSDERDCTCADQLHAQFLERKICDGVVDCQDNSDEQFCEWCGAGKFICPGARVCVNSSVVCDGRFDCPDGADEQRCVTLAASRTTAGTPPYQPDGYMMVRRRGRWGPLCLDNFEALVRQTGTSWSVQELGRAVCSALTYKTATHVFRTESEPVPASEPDEPFYKLVLSGDDSALNTSLVFEEAVCPRRTAVHISCQDLQCGLRPRVREQPTARIVGGRNTVPGAWPWQAAMYREGEYQCGATLISDRWLLSAGHCFLRSRTSYWVARLGAYRRGSSLLSPVEALHVVSHIVVHPDYQDVGYVNDIAMLKLHQPVSMSDYVRPVCLPPPGADVVEGALCTVVGWGQLFEAGRIFPDTLQEVQLPLISSRECKKRTVFLPLYRITDNMFCAGFERGGRDACLGDSGGPLMCQERTGEWTLQGITSNGYGCARAARPGVYTKVANYIGWIEDVMSGPMFRRRRTRCDGHRCPLGRCLPSSSVCDGVIHCSDASDERGCQS